MVIDMNKVPGASYCEAVVQAGLSPLDICQLLRITERTERNYRTNGCPVVVYKWLRFMAGYMEDFSRDWHGWQMRDGKLYSDQLHHNHHFSPGHIIAIWWDKQTIRSLKTDKRKLQAQIERLEHEQENNVVIFPGRK